MTPFSAKHCSAKHTEMLSGKYTIFIKMDIPKVENNV